MPRIRKFEAYIGTRGARTVYTGQVFYDTEHKAFCVRFDNYKTLFSVMDNIKSVAPSIFKSKIGITSETEWAIFGKDEDDAERQAKKYLEEYHQTLESRRDVILYDIEHVKSGEDDNYFFDGSKHFTNLKLKINYCYAVEVSANEKKTYLSESGQNISIFHKEKYIAVSRTPESEAFFQVLQERFDSLIDLILEHLGSETRVLKAIENQVKLLK